MKVYNLYYKNERINNRYLKKEEADNIMKEEFIYKKRPYQNSIEKIPTNKVKVVMCTLVG